MDVVWLVAWSYCGDEEEVVDSVWADCDEAKAYAATVEADREVYVRRLEIRRAAQPQVRNEGKERT